MAFCFDAAVLDTDLVAGAKPPPVVEAEKAMLKQFQAADPALKGQIQPEESVRKCLQVIESLDAETSGLFLSHNGDRAKWL